jgi:general stress protein 13
MALNQKVKAQITSIVNYGIFVKFDQKRGFIHISEVSEHFIKDLNDFFKVGEIITAEIIKIDEQNRYQLSYKKLNQLHPKVKRLINLSRGFEPLANQLPKWIKEYQED